MFRSGKPYGVLELGADVLLPAGFQTPPWDIIRQDPAGIVAAGVITVERDGFYLATASMSRPAVALSSAIFVRLQLNGSRFFTTQSAASTTTLSLAGARYAELTAGDTLVAQFSTHNTVPTILSAAGSHFSLVRLGPTRWT